MGGISRTINYKGNRIDIGGHRFFSRSDRVMELVASDIAAAVVRCAATHYLPP